VKECIFSPAVRVIYVWGCPVLIKTLVTEVTNRDSYCHIFYNSSFM